MPVVNAAANAPQTPHKCTPLHTHPARPTTPPHTLQIPHIQAARYPPELSGPLYPDGLPIQSESDLDNVIAEQHVDVAVLAYR